MYSEEALPDWVGKLEGNVNYRDYLRSKGVDVPAVDDGDDMIEVAADVDDADVSVDVDDNEDVAKGTPTQSHAMEANTPEQPAPIDTNRHQSTVINKQHQLQSNRHSNRHQSTCSNRHQPTM